MIIGKIAFNTSPARLFDYVIIEDKERPSVGGDANSVIGCRVEVPFGYTATRRGYLVGISDSSSVPPSKLRKILRFVDAVPPFVVRQNIGFAQALASKYFVSVGEILDLIYHLNLPPCCEDGIPSGESGSFRIEKNNSDGGRIPRVSIVCAGFGERIKRYKKIIAETLSQEVEGSVIVILPTEEDVRYFAGYLAEFNPSIWDSSLKPSQMAEFYRYIGTRIKSGSPSRGGGHLVIGTRRASFLYPWNLKRIIIERDYDYGHKDGRSPYYTTRDVIMTRACFSDVEVISGGLVFSLAIFNLIKSGAARLADGKLPPPYYGGSADGESVFSVETKQDFSKVDYISSYLKDYLDSVYLIKGECAVIHAPRKSGKNFYYCRSCRKVLPDSGGVETHPPHDAVLKDETSNNDKSDSFVKPVLACPHCGSRRIYKKSYPGADFIAKSLSAMYPDASISVVSSASGKTHSASELPPDVACRLKTADFIVATAPVQPWRVEKKIGITLVIDAGSELIYPEYFSSEKFFLNVAEYLDFSGEGAQVVLFPSPGSPAFVSDPSWWKNFYNFYDSEIDNRRALGYPPFGNIIEITLLARASANVVERHWRKITEDIKNLIASYKEIDPNAVVELMDSSEAVDITESSNKKKSRRSAKYLRRIILKYDNLPDELKNYILSLPSERVKVEVTPSLTFKV